MPVLCCKPLLTQSFHQRLLGYFSNFKLPLALTKLRTYKEKLFYGERKPAGSGYMLDCALSSCRR